MRTYAKLYIGFILVSGLACFAYAMAEWQCTEPFHYVCQVAIALLNARSYVEIQQRADREARITSIGLKIKSTTSIEAALKATVRELGRTLDANDIQAILEAPGLAQHSQKPD